ncbi:acetate/propionate family kinase [Formosa sp. L2A11]|uniref:acetate/propionate family kinase n=1 Tax=Formosa sp. L2A11 TaxID=2686363 RepID=UPI00131CEFDF|nr:acetate kinase [Formosa sp. L2A11]
MKILVINSGSSSIKFQLIEMPSETVVASGLVERIGLDEGTIHYKHLSDKITLTLPVPNHSVGLAQVAKMLMDENTGVIKDVAEIDLVGHRVVHGGKKFSDPVEVTEEIKEKIHDLILLAPLHNPPNLDGIEVAEKIFKNSKQIALFDTAFHQTLPEVAYRYAIPNKFFKDDNIRVYGFHGLSHKYVTNRAVEFLDKPDAKLISIHLGNGCSMTAVQNGQSLDHTLGFGPNDGLIMGTRSGAIDQSVIFFLMNKYNYTKEEIVTVLSKESGMFGLTGYSDLRDIEAEAEKGNKECILALEMNVYRIKKFIGAYTATLKGLDAIVFTAGIGENSATMRKMICDQMDYFGIHLDQALNAERLPNIRSINTPDSKTKILIVPTNEELEIATECYENFKE